MTHCRLKGSVAGGPEYNVECGMRKWRLPRGELEANWEKMKAGLALDRIESLE